MNNSFAKINEKYQKYYYTNIACPIVIVDYEEANIISNFEKNDIEKFKFKIKNFQDEINNSIEYYYYFEILGDIDGIKWEIINVETEEKIEFENTISQKMEMSFENRVDEYVFKVYMNESSINVNKDLKLRINTIIKENE